jgi:NUMOD3 motif
MKHFYVYGYTREDGSYYYIGKGRGTRKTDGHYGRKGKYISKPRDRTYIVTISDNMTEADAFQLEMLLIHLHGKISDGTGILRNVTDGGEGASGHRHSDSTKAKIGRPKSAEERERISQALKGKPLSEETKAKMSASRRGKKKTAVTRASMSAAQRGRVMSPEHKEKLSQAASRRWERERLKRIA